MKSWYALALVVFLTIVFAWVFRVERSGRAEPIPVAADAREDRSRSELSQEVVGLRKEPAQMKDQLARVVQQQVHRPPDGPATAVQLESEAGMQDVWEQARGDEAQEMLEMDAQEQEAQERQRIEQIVSHLDDSFHSEPFDNGWAAQIEAGIAQDFGSDDWEGNALAEVRCRSTLCRIVVAHEAPNAVDTFVARMGTLQAFANTEGFYQQITFEDGTAATVVYIAREGHQLPAMPSP